MKENEKILIEKKIYFFKDIIQKTIIYLQKNKILDILAINDISTCIDKLIELNNELNNISQQTNTELVINNLQIINNELSSLLKSYGTSDLEDLLIICFGNNKITNDENELIKYELLKKYFHPISYTVFNKEDNKKINKTEKSEKHDKSEKNEKNEKNEKIENLNCIDISNTTKKFYIKVYGIKLYIYNTILKKGIIITGIIDDIIIDVLNNKYILKKKKEFIENIPNDVIFHTETFNKFISSLTLKDYLINNTHLELYEKFVGYISQSNTMKQKSITQVIKEFVSNDIYLKRLTLIQLLIKSDKNYENQYLAYLLYDLLSNELNDNIDTLEQIILFDIFPWSIKEYFKNAMNKTIQYTNKLSNFDINKISLEQQICLLNTSDNIKEKAMIKLKEIKSKSEDSGTKARQYLDGLLKIPFNIFKYEPILNLMDTIRNQFKNLYINYEINKKIPDILVKDKYTSIEIMKYIKEIKEKLYNYDLKYINNLKKIIICGNKQTLILNIIKINTILSNFENLKINHSNKKSDELKKEINLFLDTCFTNYTHLLPIINKLFTVSSPKSVSTINKDIESIETNLLEIKNYTHDVKNILDASIYGQNKAKRQIERVISQWINSNNNNVGHVLGFEGNPGIGKTTLAKGLSKCLKDENGNSRPFALIAVGGDANASSLIGHSYTYVGSTWGQIVQILIDTKCMNPIILIDEVDKISKTEHGKEITGIFTHLLDPTQNNTFQDKYFSGIELDLSKVLFILSYNDVESIDKILLDRIHRIKFDSLSIEEKIIICNKHLLPEIYTNIGLENLIHFSDEVLYFIIEEYTIEPGVRKLKEKLFEIISELNLNTLKTNTIDFDLPIQITIEDIKTNYFKDKKEVRIQKIHPESQVGMINCLWANVYNIGGILSTSACFYPSDKYLSLKLTGLLDKMMEESFQISLTVAYSLLTEERKHELKNKYDTILKYGIHLHMGDGSIEKSGTSAGVAVTLLFYSLLTNKKIKNTWAVTGEISDLNGKSGEIGALKTKIIYGIKSGVKNFIFPKENEKDFKEFMDKYEKTDIIKGIQFYPISHVNEAIKLIIED